LKAESFVIGVFFGKFDRSSTAITCFAAPIAKRSSVALGDNEIILDGILVAAVALGIIANTRIADKIGTKNFFADIKKLPQTLREEAGLKKDNYSSRGPTFLRGRIHQQFVRRPGLV